LGVAVAAPDAADLKSDSLLIQEIADSLHVKMDAIEFKAEGGRITRVRIFYRSQRGAVPAALGGLDSLRNLFIGTAAITSLPKEIGRLKRLDTLDISSIQIDSLPDGIGDLESLKLLRVFYCQLRTLPSSLMRLRNLEHVDFRSNYLCGVPDSLAAFIRGISPGALEAQRKSDCGTTGLEQVSPKNGETRKKRELGLAGAQNRKRKKGRAADRARIFSADGRPL
jgi:hypothetical protein